MSTQIRAFAFDFKGRAVRVVGTQEAPLFVASDVCAALEIEWKGSGSTGPLDDDEKGVVTVNTPGGPQQMLCVTESGLYALIFKSRKEQAREFRKWVTAEVLPAIRQTGGYTALPDADTGPAKLIAALAALAASHVRLEDRVRELEDFVTAPQQKQRIQPPTCGHRGGRPRKYFLSDFLPAIITRVGNGRVGFNEIKRAAGMRGREASFARIISEAVAAGAVQRMEDGSYALREAK